MKKFYLLKSYPCLLEMKLKNFHNEGNETFTEAIDSPLKQSWILISLDSSPFNLKPAAFWEVL